MKSSVRFWVLLVGGVGHLWAAGLQAQQIGPWDREKLYEVPAYERTDRASVPGMVGLLYDGLEYRGKKSQVFVYYKAPEGPKPASGWPAVVCVHGGGGTAFADWVQEWVNHGYAAISMDLEGRVPGPASHRPEGRTLTPAPGPVRDGVFNDCELPVEEQWFYHAVAQVVRAHSLLRSFPEVDAQRTGVTGISWGGILTSAVSGVDDRFRFAVPVYGCGFLAGSDGRMGNALATYSETKLKRYQELWDPSNFLVNAKMPILWVNGTNDAHFPMPAWQASADTAKGQNTLRLQVRMPHGHPPGWKPEEIYAFADSIVKDGKPLPKVGMPKIDNGAITAEVETAVPIASASLCFTADTGVWEERLWEQAGATVANGKVQAVVPEKATVCFLTVTDERGLMTSSRFVILR